MAKSRGASSSAASAKVKKQIGVRRSPGQLKRATHGAAQPVVPDAQRIRVGVIVGKNFDPIPQGTQDREYPSQLRCMKNTGPSASGWGGMFQIDVSVALKMARLCPGLLKVDIIPGRQVSAARLRKNHVTFNLFYDVVIADYDQGKARGRQVKQLFKDPNLRMWPSFDYYDWVCNKARYMKQCRTAGIPMIDTIYVEGKLDAQKVLAQVQAKGWDRCFIKNGAYVCFGNGAVHGNTQDLINDPSIIRNFLNENKGITHFLVQPYTLKPNGQVFDEVRNFFIDGRWAYSVYTDGTDNDAVYEQPAGRLKDACRQLAERTMREALKVSKWRGRAVAPLVCRVDIGFVPDKARPEGFRIFMNEIETEISTWLPRYSARLNVCNEVAKAGLQKIAEMCRPGAASGHVSSEALRLLKRYVDSHSS